MSPRPLLPAIALALVAVPAGLAGYEEGMALYRLKDYEGAFQELLPAAEEGDVRAQYRLGLLYYRGRGVAQSYGTAASWYRRAAASGHLGAHYELGYLYQEGQGVPRSFAEARRWYGRAAEEGHAPSQNNLGHLLCCVRGAEHDDAEALRWFRTAAERGNARAQHSLGWFYSTGRAVETDRVEAFLWLCRSAVSGRPQAGAAVDRLLAEMSPEELDRAEAAAVAELDRRGPENAREALRRLADLGRAESQFRLARMMADGIGGDLDGIEAYKWLALAENAGHPEAGAELAALAEGMPSAYLQDAHTRIGRWVSEHDPPIAAPEEAIYRPDGDKVTRPRLLKKVPVRYPPQARKDEETGLVIVEALITTEGVPTDVTVLRSDNPGHGFEEAAIEAVRQWRYEPAFREGWPVAVRYPIVVEFLLK